jgi:hypothetical protein
LKAATNLNFVQPKLFRATRQDDLRFSDCTVSVIQILDDADVAFRSSGAELRTVLSATTIARRQAAPPQRVFDDLASGYRTHGWATRAAGYRAAISWHFSDMSRRPDDVRSSGQSRHPTDGITLPVLTKLLHWLCNAAMAFMAINVDVAPDSYPVALRVWRLPSCTVGAMGQGAEPSASMRAAWRCRYRAGSDARSARPSARIG